jgi:hypothetical protein
LSSAKGQAGNFQTIALNGQGRPLGGVNVAVCQGIPITSVAVSSSIVTLTVSSNPITAGFTIGSSVQVYNVPSPLNSYNSPLNAGVFTYQNITGLSPTTITFINSSATGSGATAGNVVQIGGPTVSCLPLATVYTDTTGTVTASNPFTSDGRGNVNFYALANPYLLQYYSTTVTTTTYVVTVACVPGSATGTCGIQAGANNTFSGNNSFTGTISAVNLNTALYVGGALGASFWGSSDIGAQFNAAYATLSSDGEIDLIPQTGGGCYLYTTPIVMNTAGKYIRVRPVSVVGSASGTTTSGACIQYQHTTATTALIYDVTPAAGGSYVGGEGWQDVAILNSSTDLGSTPCETNGGCGSSATGLKIGGTNGGAQLANWFDLAVKGFGKCVDSSGSLGVGWAMNFYSISLAYCTIGHNSDGTEGDTFYGGSISVNSTGVKLTGAGSGAANKRFIGTHFDSNTVLSIDGTTAGSAGTIDCVGCHFENLGTSNVNYVNLSGGVGILNLIGGEALEDSSSGSAAAYWFTANYINCSNIQLFQNVGRAAPTSLFVGTLGGNCDVIDNSPTTIPVANLGLATLNHRIVGSGIASEMGSAHLQASQATPPLAAWGTGGGGGATCSGGLVGSTDSWGAIDCTTGTGPSASGTIQIQFQKTFTNNTTGCIVYPNNTATAWLGTSSFAENTPTNTTDTFTWNTNGAALTASVHYRVTYICPGR